MQFLGDAGSRLFILICGDNLIRHDFKLQYRLSPDICQTLGPLELLSPLLLEEWNVSYLVEPKARSHVYELYVLQMREILKKKNISATKLIMTCTAFAGQLGAALRMPTDVLKDWSSSTKAIYLMLEIWRATVLICTLRLSTADIMLAAGSQLCVMLFLPWQSASCKHMEFCVTMQAVKSASRAQLMSSSYDLPPASSGVLMLDQHLAVHRNFSLLFMDSFTFHYEGNY